tara:strand:- start:28 stop:1395 length:1368 start_codon:yes stop_codon:yes gene_type:complete
MDTNHISKKSRLNEFIDNPQKALWKLAIPMMFGMLIQAVYMLTDTAFIGKWVGADALAALGYVFPYMFIIMGITFGLGSGATSVIARYIGRKDKASADIAAGQTIMIGIIISVIIVMITLIFKENIFTIQNASGQAARDALAYFRILSAGSIFMILSMFIRAILSGEGDNLFPMKVLGSGTVLNIILDPIFIYYYDIQGAAIATILSQLTVCIIFFYYLGIRQTSYLNLSLTNFNFDTAIIKEILTIGIPSSLSMMIMAMGAFIFNIILNGPNAVAAVQTAGRIEHLFFLPIISISSSLVTLVGMFFGAERFDLIKSIIKYGLKVGVLFSCVSAFFFYAGAKHITPFFTDSAEITAITISYFSIVCFSYPFVTIGMTSSRIMQGLGYGKPTLVLTLIRVVLINAPLGYFITRIMQLPIFYIWYSILFSSFVASTLGLIWMKIVINKEQKKISAVT